MLENDKLVIAGREFRSRLIVGTGKYRDYETMRKAHEASGADIVTVAVRRVDLTAKESLLDHIDRTKYMILPNTAGCYTAQEANPVKVTAGTNPATGKIGSVANKSHK